MITYADAAARATRLSHELARAAFEGWSPRPALAIRRELAKAEDLRDRLAPTQYGLPTAATAAAGREIADPERRRIER